MIICFKCSENTKMALDRLVASGEYADYGDVIGAAVGNLEVMHAEMGSRASVVMAAGKGDVDGGVATAGGNLPGPGVPAIFSLAGLQQPPKLFAKSQPSQWRAGDHVPIDGWVFGQYNRLLPAKATCRALAHMLMDTPEGIPIDEARRVIADAALELGRHLRGHDQRHSIHRDEALAIAFPSDGDKSEKSKLRYADQFVAYVDKEGRLHGLPAAYCLVGHALGSEGLLSLTRDGWALAQVRNPILDGRQRSPTEKLGEEEIGVLRGLVVAHLPEEQCAFQVIQSILQSGWKSPGEVDEMLARLQSTDETSKATNAFRALQRAGVLSRMLDLGLVRRSRKGVRIQYGLAEPGE